MEVPGRRKEHSARRALRVCCREPANAVRGDLQAAALERADDRAYHAKEVAQRRRA
jgi:hypothetical protein